MSGWIRWTLLLAMACASRPVVRLEKKPAPTGEALKDVAAFKGIGDPAEKSRALFVEAGRVLLHPRCSNCHPEDDSPRQRDGEPHEPLVVRGPDDRGIPSLQCNSCHQDTNVVLSRVPGAPLWHLAPKSMAWRGRSLSAICEQIKDKARNGNKTLEEIVEHSAHDALVGWAWNPGADRQPAPGTQKAFGELMAAWAESGAHCPVEGSSK